MAEYIERETLYEKAYWHGEHPDVGNPFPDGVDAIDIEDVDAIPAADVAPVRHGRWKPYHEADIGYDEYGVRCSNCKFEVEDHEVNFIMKYCPNCGAKMDGGTDR